MPNSSEHWSPIAALILMVATSVSLCESSTAIAAALPVERAQHQWSSSTRTVVIDGREFLPSVNAFLVGVTNSSGASATISIRITSVDGDALPAGLTAEHIRLQRFDSPSRIIHRDLVVTDTPVATPGAAEYYPESNFITAAGAARFRTTIRLATSQGDTFVRMGTIRVNTGTLVNADPVEPPDLR